MSADLLEAFGSGTQSSVTQARVFSGQTNASRTKIVSTESNSIQILPTRSQPQHDDNVLFDADLYEAADVAQFRNGDDEFGDFEQANGNSIPASSELTLEESATQSGSLIDLDDHESLLLSPAPSKTRFRATSRPMANTHVPEISQLTTSEQKSLSTNELIEDEDEDEWGQFEDVNPAGLTSAVKHKGEKSMNSRLLSKSKGPLAASKSGQNPKITDRTSLYQEQVKDDAFNEEWDEFDEDKPEALAAYAAQSKGNSQELVNASARSGEARGDRPTNVPPPAILLSLFPKAFSLLGTQAEQTSNDGLGAQVLEAYRVCARIIAGRQLRWKRDTVLAQSMRIGAAGRSGGMKLTTLDKSEARREEQDAQEAISSWSRLSHKLNAVMVKTKIAKPPASLSTSLAVRIATGADVLTSNHICPICGLKRNERITGIDVNVTDIFGEFWVEHWGHRDCHEIWYTYSHLLDQR